MGYKFNPLKDLGLDLTGSSSGGSGGLAERYFATFNATSDWTLSSPNYTRTILASTHGKGTTPNVSVYETNGADYDLVNILIKINASGDVTMITNESPDTRFAGLILII